MDAEKGIAVEGTEQQPSCLKRWCCTLGIRCCAVWCLVVPIVLVGLLALAAYIFLAESAAAGPVLKQAPSSYATAKFTANLELSSNGDEFEDEMDDDDSAVYEAIKDSVESILGDATVDTVDTSSRRLRRRLASAVPTASAKADFTKLVAPVIAAASDALRNPGASLQERIDRRQAIVKSLVREWKGDDVVDDGMADADATPREGVRRLGDKVDLTFNLEVDDNEDERKDLDDFLVILSVDDGQKLVEDLIEAATEAAMALAGYNVTAKVSDVEGSVEDIYYLCRIAEPFAQPDVCGGGINTAAQNSQELRDAFNSAGCEFGDESPVSYDRAADELLMSGTCVSQFSPRTFQCKMEKQLNDMLGGINDLIRQYPGLSQCTIRNTADCSYWTGSKYETCSECGDEEVKGEDVYVCKN